MAITGPKEEEDKQTENNDKNKNGTKREEEENKDSNEEEPRRVTLTRDKDTKDKNPLGFIMLLSMFLIIVLVAGFFVYKKFQIEKYEPISNLQEENSNELIEYVREMIEQGNSRADIEKSLIEVGWPYNTVQELLSRFEKKFK